MRAVAPPPPSLYPCRRPVPSLACSPRLSSHAPPGPSCRWPRPARLGVAPRGAPISASFPAIFDVRLRVSTNGGGARSRGVARGRHSGGARGAAVKSKARARGGTPRQTDTFLFAMDFISFCLGKWPPKRGERGDTRTRPGPSADPRPNTQCATHFFICEMFPPSFHRENGPRKNENEATARARPVGWLTCVRSVARSALTGLAAGRDEEGALFFFFF